jgi:hypothetical protein
MDPNTYVLAAVLNGLRQKELSLSPLEAEFTPFKPVSPSTDAEAAGAAFNGPREPSGASA